MRRLCIRNAGVRTYVSGAILLFTATICYYCSCCYYDSYFMAKEAGFALILFFFIEIS